MLLDGLAGGMARKGFATVDQLRGMLAVAPGADERAGYVNALRRANSNTHGPS